MFIIVVCILYTIFGLLTILGGMILAGIEYNYYGGHHNKKLLWMHIGLSILFGLIWPIMLILLAFGCGVEIWLDKTNR